jgi:hypothetical protein
VKYVQNFTFYKPMKTKFQTKLYELMKHGNSLIYVAHDVIFALSKD